MINMYYAVGALFSYATKSVHWQGFCPPNFIQYDSANVTDISQKARLNVSPFPQDWDRDPKLKPAFGGKIS